MREDHLRGPRLDRLEDGNMFTAEMCHEIRDCINAICRETRTRVIVITGAGDNFFCIGGRKQGMERLVNRVVPDDRLAEKTRELALEVADRGALALAAIKGAFNARHGGVGGFARVAHDLLLPHYLDSDEAKALSRAFRGKREQDAARFGH